MVRYIWCVYVLDMDQGESAGLSMARGMVMGRACMLSSPNSRATSTFWPCPWQLAYQVRNSDSLFVTSGSVSAFPSLYIMLEGQKVVTQAREREGEKERRGETSSDEP